MPEKPSPVADRPLGTEESLAKSLQELTAPKDENIDFLTELDDEEILNLTALRLWGEETGFDIFKNFCIIFERLKVSKFRQGRKEISLGIGLASGGGGGGVGRGLRSLISSLRL